VTAAAGTAVTLLALDTATASGGVALVRGAVVLAEEAWQSGGQQTATVLPAAARLWERAGLSPQDLDAVAVSLGPGSYTGLRVGLSLAKGFALARGLPLVGVPTLEAVAYQHREASAALCAVVAAGRGMYHVGTFVRRRGGVVQEGDYAVLDAAELAARLAAAPRPPLLCGELYPDLVASLRAAGPPAPGVRYATPAAALRRPAFLAELALARLDAVRPADAAGLQPLYLRRTP
jgi:tRNA threonylcarbamoyladenosine biosynthesis protein TsaB